MNLVKPNWYGLDHAAVARTFEGNPTFVNDICVKGEYAPSAVYYCARPNKRKGHCKYVILTKNNGNMYIRGMSPREMNKYRYQSGIHCLGCNEVIYSVNRHDFRFCKCQNVSIDGGKDYTKIGFTGKTSYTHVRIDLLTDIIT